DYYCSSYAGFNTLVF
nr:immunoglobulin light chain junction region [Macaca mulatta]